MVLQALAYSCAHDAACLSLQNVVHHFTTLAADPRCRFFGNVTVGGDVSIYDLRTIYDAVVLAYGADSDRRLNIPGEVRMVTEHASGLGVV